MSLKLCFSNRIVDLLYNLNKHDSAKYVSKHFEVVCFHLVFPLYLIACGFVEKQKKFEKTGK